MGHGNVPIYIEKVELSESMAVVGIEILIAKAAIK